MNRLFSVWVAALLGSGCFLSIAGAQDAPGIGVAPAPPATAPAPGPVALLPATKAPGAITPAVQQDITGFIQANVATLRDGTGAQQKQARDRLIGECTRANDPNVSSIFIAAYVTALDDAITGLLKSDKPPLRARLQAGVIAAAVADRAGGYAAPLADSAVLLLADPSEAVVIWGMKTAKAVLHSVLALPPGQHAALLNAIVPTALKYPGPVLDEAYQALTLVPLNLPQNPAKVGGATPQIRLVLPHLQKLLVSRLPEYDKGTPKSPLSDSLATNFLSVKGIWDIQNPAQQKQTVQLMNDLVVKAGVSFKAMGGKEREDLSELIKRASGGLLVIGGFVNDPGLQNAARDLMKIIPGVRNEQLDEWLKALTPAVTGMKMMQVPAVTGGPATQATSAGAIGQN